MIVAACSLLGLNQLIGLFPDFFNNAAQSMVKATTTTQKFLREGGPKDTAETIASAKRIRGEVISVTGDGVLVRSGEELIYISGDFHDYVDGDRVSVLALPTGTYTYTSAIGAVKTVRAYRRIRE